MNAKGYSVWPRVISILLIIGLAVIGYLLFIRPWHIRWGATDQEVAQTMPGDSIAPDAGINFTRAVTINAPPETVWPWLVQLGHQRAGFYSYDWFDNDGIRSAETILPQFQKLEEGDPIRISQSTTYYVWSMAVEKHLVWVSDDDPPSGIWTWALYPINDGQTRLITRMNGTIDWNSPGVLLSLWVDTGDIAFMRKSMLGIKQRAEGNIVDSYATDVTEGILWAMTFAEFIVAITLIFTRRLWWRAWLCAIGAALVFLTIFYVRPAIWVMIILAGLVLIGLLWAFRTSASPRKKVSGYPATAIGSR